MDILNCLVKGFGGKVDFLSRQMFTDILLVKEDISFTFSGTKVVLYQNGKIFTCDYKSNFGAELFWES